MRPASYLSERIGGGNGNSDRRNHSSFYDTKCEQCCAESTDQRLKRLRELSSLKVLGSHVVSEQWGGCNNGCDCGNRGQRSSYYRIEATKMDVFSGKSFVNRCALLKEKHPRGHSCTNVSQHDDQSILTQTARERL